MLGHNLSLRATKGPIVGLSRLLRPQWSTQRTLRCSTFHQKHISLGSEPKAPVGDEGPRVTVLPNGIRVATHTTPGYFCGFGAYLDVGSRVETPQTRGCTHMLDRMAFKSTSRQTAEEISELVESMGGNIQRASSRENLIFQASVFPTDLPRIVSLFADVIQRPALLDHEIDEQRQIIAWELAEIEAKPELNLPETLHQVAYRGNTLGNPQLCSEEVLATMSAEKLRHFLGQWFTADRLVISAIGAPHDEVCALVKLHYGQMKPHPAFRRHPTVAISDKYEPGPLPSAHDPAAVSPSPVVPDATPAPTPSSTPTSRTSSLLGSFGQTASKLFRSTTDDSAAASSTSAMDVPTLVSQPAHYTGGTLLKDLPEAPQTHIHLAFRAPGMNSSAIYPLAVLQILLGGGDSFSAGGPGKGMYSRLYTQVLNRYMFVESCAAFTFSYRDSSLFGISAICESSATHSMLEVIIRQLVALLPPSPGMSSPSRTTPETRGTTTANDPSSSSYLPNSELAQSPVVQTRLASLCFGLHDTEVARAKNQLKSSLMMNLESRPIQLEDLGRQIQGFNAALTPAQMCASIDRVTKVDLYRLVQYMLASEPTLVVSGNVGPIKHKLPGLFASYGLKCQQS
ncbi:Mitochondrial-processing peptidase subunit alpha [Dimargaris cristalligena]|nr:Mitochondrial-processing peptidase subunit alpha [Dimargaris cristalligena]